MKRRNFLKGFAAAVAVVSVAPMAVAKTTELKPIELMPSEWVNNIVFARNEKFCNPKEVLELYYRTGILVWRSHDNSVERLELLRTGTQDIEAYKKAFE